MADDKPTGSWGSSIVVLAFAAVSAAYVAFQQPTLTSTRPTEPEYQIHGLKGLAQDVEARLWQDPFGAVERAIEDKRNAKVDPSAGHCVADFRKLLNRRADPALLIGVTLPGDPYPETDETRRRLRYAVLSALHVAKYTAVDERHIGYFLTREKLASGDSAKPETVASGFFRVAGAGAADPPAEGVFGVGVSVPAANCAVKTEETRDNQLSIPAIVPYERYQGPDGHRRIFILWLDEEALEHGSNPIASFAGLRSELDIHNNKDQRFVVVGPQDSNLLQTMVKEIEKNHHSDLNRLPENCILKSQPVAADEVTASTAIPIASRPDYQTQKSHADDDLLPLYNFGATAEDKIIFSNSGVPSQIKNTECLFLLAGVRYYRTISSDEALAEVLAKELQRRGIDLCPEQNPRDPSRPADTRSRCHHPYHHRVLLLSEWDTFYGRSLPKSVAATFGADASRFGDCRLNTERGIMYFSYLRGLDGRLPSHRPAKDEKPAADQGGDQSTTDEQTTAAAATPDTTGQFEAAEGQSQFDYLSRLTAELKDCDRKLRLEDAGKIAAIGVLGSDVYDKLLLLQALRPEFPEAVFFTTDLDELLLPQKGKLRYTRNLLVASGFGLTLNPALQKDVLPFRNTYQTSAFLATRLAIRNDDLIKPLSEQENLPTSAKANAPKIGPWWADTAAAVRCWSKQPLLFQIGRTAPRGLPIDPVAGEFDACKDLGKDPKADFVNYSTIQPEVPRLYQNFTEGARWGVFLFVIALLVISLLLPPIRKVLFFTSASAEPRRDAPAADSIVTSVDWLKPLAVAALVGWALVTLYWPTTARWLTEYGTPNGEPIALFEGISVWPTIASRVFGIVLSLFLIWYTLRTLEINLLETAAKIGIQPLVEPREEMKPSVKTKDEMDDKRGIVARWAAKTLSRLWFPPESSYQKLDCHDAERPKVAFRDIVSESSLKPGARCLRAAFGTVCMMLLWEVILVPVFGGPLVTARGDRAQTYYFWTTMMDVLTTLFLTFLVADATLHSGTFISRLTRISTAWPPETVSKFEQRFGLQEDALADWLDMKYIAVRTGFITQLIYLPFLSLTVLFLSRNHLFDDFAMPWTLPASQAISIAVVVGSVLSYRFAAENARKTAHDHLTAKIVAAQGNRRNAAQLERMLNEIESLREGAFAPLTSQPVVKAVLLPLVTYGGAWITHLYGLPGS